jgi:tRNA-2-methylthio-N6-dimethylallyladenosine synthase
MKYYLWTEGCQMNAADSQRVASALEHLGYQNAARVDEADVIVMNTCVVRQSAEDKAVGRLSSLQPLKQKRPELVINLMGCLVGIKNHDLLKARFPYVDVFSPPSDIGPLVSFLTQNEVRKQEEDETDRRYSWMDGELALPPSEYGQVISAFIPVVLGCSHACTYCIIPYRRGAERSRPPQAILAEARAMVAQGVREITLLGQIVDRYGKDDPTYPNLAGLIRRLHAIDGLERIRFLTSHPNWMNDELLDALAELPRVMPHIEVPAQAGDDQVLENMHRGYTADQYCRLVEKLRQRMPGVSIATDIIVGFPGETRAQFQHTYDMLAELKLDVAHLARYSPRPGTLASRQLQDDVPDEEKWQRFRLLEDLQEKIAAEIHTHLLGQQLPVMFEEKVKKRWRGRTPTNKLVFVETDQNLAGQVLPVEVTWAGPWSMIGKLAEVQVEPQPFLL